MEYEGLFTDSKWAIIKELANKKQSPTELAKKTNTSIANISQQLRLLEAYNLVIKEKLKENNVPGKPKVNYRIAKEVSYIVHITQDSAEKKLIETNPLHQMLLNIIFLEKTEDQEILMNFFGQSQDLFVKCQSILLLKSESNKIELTLITDHVDNIRTKYSNITIETSKKTKKDIACWTHSMQELEEGIHSKNEHFMKITTKVKTLYDPSNLILKIRALRNE
jgi:DNA-binding HxlR family transcriptional regulator